MAECKTSSMKAPELRFRYTIYMNIESVVPNQCLPLTVFMAFSINTFITDILYPSAITTNDLRNVAEQCFIVSKEVLTATLFLRISILRKEEITSSLIFKYSHAQKYLLLIVTIVL